MSVTNEKRKLVPRLDLKFSDYIIEEWAKQKGMTIEKFMEWIKSRKGWKKVKKFWKGLDKP